MFKSVKVKISIIAFFIISIIMGVSTIRDIREAGQNLVNGQKEKAALLSERIEHEIKVLMLKNRWQDLQAFVENIVKDSKEIKEARIFLPEDGTIVVSSEQKDIGGKVNEKDLNMFRKQAYQDAFLIEKDGEQFASKLTVIPNQPACYKCHGSHKEMLGVISIDISLSSADKTLQDFKREHYTDAIIAFFVIGGGILFIVWMLVDRPIKKMIHTIRRIENGDLSARMDEGKKDEFGLMAKSFNRMVESLESAKKEVERYHLEQMQRVSRLASLGEIVSGIAHEIKNPLTGISCAVQIIQSEFSGDDNKREITGEILNQIKRLDKIVKNLLNYASPKPLRFFPYNIGKILEKALFLVYPEANSHNITISTEIQDNIPDVMMDPDQMQQVFLNLMINAIQAMPDGGRLAISVSAADSKKIEYEAEGRIQSEKMLVVGFEDSGKGIEHEYMGNIFDPFFTLKTQGTGLGLSISQRIIQEHGGEIIVKSEVGKGSVFTVLLPVINEVKTI